MKNVLEAGERSRTLLSFALTKNVYSTGPGGRVMVRLFPEVAFQPSSMPTTFVSKVMRLSCSGSADPVNSKETLFFAIEVP